MKRNIIIALAFLFGFAQGAWATTYSYYIVERDPSTNTLYFRGTNTEPSSANHQYSITDTSGEIPTWAQDLDAWKSITTIIFEPSFAGAEPTSTAYWFARKPNLTSITGLHFLNTSNVTTMAMMFYECSILTEVDLSGFNTENVTSMYQMFYNCSSLRTIGVGSGWTTSNVSYKWNVTDEMFKGCTALVGQDGTTYNASNLSKDYAHYGTGGYLTTEAKYWSSRVASSFSDVGTNTITIHNAGELKLLASNVNAGDNYSGYTILLAKDMALEPSIANNFTTIGSGSSDTYHFAGTFDGQGHTITGLNISGVGRQGLFGTVSGGSISNLTLDNSTITSTSSSYAGGIVGRVSDGGTITNCHVTNGVTVTAGNSAGGIVGSIYLGTVSITGCTSAAKDVQSEGSNNSAGGIVGFCGHEGSSSETLSATIADCLYHGTSVSGGEGVRIGAIVGGYVTNSNSTVSLSNNFYSYPNASVKGIGYKKVTSDVTSTPFDVAANHGAVCTRVVTSDDDISDMGAQSGNTYSGGIAVYANGVKYGDTYYSHVLALPDGADNTALISQHNGQTFNVKLRGRTLFKDGSWNTLCLPFSISNLSGSFLAAAKNCEVRELDLGKYQIKPSEGEPYGDYRTGVQDGKLYLFFKQTTSISAGTPYIVKWERVPDYNANDPATYDYVSPTFNDVTINNTLNPVTSSNDGGKLTFQSSYAPFTRNYQDRSVLFLGADNTLYYPSGTGPTTVGPFRAYFQLNGVQMADDSSGSGDDEYVPEGGGDVRAFIIDIFDEATGVAPLLSPQGGTIHSPLGETEGASWYTLDGRRLSGKPSHAGVYINNGIKVVIK